MKKIISSFVLIFLVPFKFSKKLLKDNFLSGLVFGAIVSLVVNILSMHIQGEIEKQRVLESIETEITTNMIKAQNDLEGIVQHLKNPPNEYVIFSKYSKSFWDQSIEPAMYVAQLDPKTQQLIVNYYMFIVPVENQLIEIANERYIASMQDCFPFVTVESNLKKQECIAKFDTYLNIHANASSAKMFEDSLKVLKTFHPTRDRINSPFLSFMMGKEAMQIMKE